MNTLPGGSGAFPSAPSRITGSRWMLHCINGKCPCERDDGLGIAYLAAHRPFVRFRKRDPVNFDDLGVLMSRSARFEPCGIKEVQDLGEYPRGAQGGAE